jgi:hypothetical protein
MESWIVEEAELVNKVALALVPKTLRRVYMYKQLVIRRSSMFTTNSDSGLSFDTPCFAQLVASVLTVADCMYVWQRHRVALRFPLVLLW